MKAPIFILSAFIQTLILVAGYYVIVNARSDDFTEYYYGGIFVFGGPVLLILFLLNAGLCFFMSKGKVWYGFNCGTIILTALLGVKFAKLIDGERHKWFVERGMKIYESSVVEIERNRYLLSKSFIKIGELLTTAPYGKNQIMARTNSDGSLFVIFTGRGNDPDSDYIYYSGNVIKPIPGEPYLYYLDDNPTIFQKITNNWYEY